MKPIGFQDLPFEPHWCVSSYLNFIDMNFLSQSSQFLRKIYLELVWKNCYIGDFELITPSFDVPILFEAQFITSKTKLFSASEILSKIHKLIFHPRNQKYHFKDNFTQFYFQSNDQPLFPKMKAIKYLKASN